MTENESNNYRTWARAIATVGVSVVLGITTSTNYCHYVSEQKDIEMVRGKAEVEVAAINAGLHQQPLLNGATGWVKIDDSKKEDGLIDLED